MPGSVEPQILWLIDDPGAVLEADDLDRMAAIVRIGEFAFDLGNPAVSTGMENVRADRHARSASRRTTNSRDVSIHCRVIEAINRNSTGFSSNNCRKPTDLHLFDKPVVARTAMCALCLQNGLGSASRLDKTLVERRGGKHCTTAREENCAGRTRADFT